MSIEKSPAFIASLDISLTPLPYVLVRLEYIFTIRFSDCSYAESRAILLTSNTFAKAFSPAAAAPETSAWTAAKAASGLGTVEAAVAGTLPGGLVVAGPLGPGEVGARPEPPGAPEP